MANVYTWKVNSMQSYPQAQGLTDVVCTINWTCEGTDGTFTASVSDSTQINIDSDGPFTPYSDLTQDQVLSWVFETLGPVQVGITENTVAAKIAVNYQPVVLPNPWGSQ